jgi:hypothetical protein
MEMIHEYRCKLFEHGGMEMNNAVKRQFNKKKQKQKNLMLLPLEFALFFSFLLPMVNYENTI